MTLVHFLDKSDYKLDVLIKEGKIQGLQGESRGRGTVAITFYVFIEHIKSLGKNQQDKAMLWLFQRCTQAAFFSPLTWGFRGSAEGTCHSFLNCVTNLNRFFERKTQTV